MQVMSACRWRHEAEIQMIILIAEGLRQRFDPLFLRTLGQGALDAEMLLQEISDAATGCRDVAHWRASRSAQTSSAALNSFRPTPEAVIISS